MTIINAVIVEGEGEIGSRKPILIVLRRNDSLFQTEIFYKNSWELYKSEIIFL